MQTNNYLKKELYNLIKNDERIFDFIQDSSLDGLWYWDIENPENEWMNAKFWTVLGYNPDEMPHKSSAWQNIINQDDLKIAIENFTKHCENPNHPYDQIVRYTHKNGSTVWIRCRGLAIRDKNGKAVRMLGAHHNITEIKNTELLLKEKNEEYESLNEELLQTNEDLYNAKEKTEKSEGKFRLIFEKSIMAILIADDKGNYLDVNQAATEIFGYSRDEFLRMNVGDLHNPIAPDVSKSYELYVKNGYEKGEFHFINKRGEHRIANYHAIRIREDFNVSIMFDITENKKVEEEIIIAKNRSEESEKRFRNMFEFHSAIMLLIEPETGKIIDANKSALEFYGYDLLTLQSMYIQDINQLNQEQIREERLRALKNNCNYFIFPHKLSNGKVRTVEVHSTPIQHEEKQILFSIIHDITEREKAERNLQKTKDKLEKKEELYRSTFEHAAVGIAHVDLKGNFTKVNNKFCLITGYPQEELYKMNISDLTHADDLVVEQEYINQVLSGRIDTYTIEKRYIHKDGHAIWIILFSNVIRDENNQIRFAVSTIFDITEQKALKDDLITSKEKAEETGLQLNAILENSPTGFAINKISTGDVIYINKAFANAYHIPMELCSNVSTFFEYVYGDRMDLGDKILSDVKSEDPERMKWDLVPIKDKKTKITHYISASNIILKEIDLMISVVNDITAQVQNENELKNAKEKAEESDKLKTAFLQNMSHEIRTPLNSIIGFSERLNASKVTEEKKQFYTDIIMKSGFQLLSIVNDVLTISAIDTGQEEVKKENVSINSLISDIEEVFKQQIDHQRVKLRSLKPLPDNNAQTLTDKTKLIQILTNLISNAIKFTSAGVIEFGYTLKNNEIEFFVKDNGIGIHKSKHEVIFERFVQAEESIHIDYGGTGLGLSICKGFAELLGGKIWVESELGKGATFYFTIPYKPTETERYDNTLSANQEEIKLNENKTALIAEDHIFNFIYLEECFEELNYKVIHAKNGEEAVEICRTNKSIDIVLMDIRMPVMDGHQAAMLIKEFRPDLTIIAQTAYATNVEIEKFGKAFDDYLTKPLTTEKLANTLNRHIK